MPTRQLILVALVGAPLILLAVIISISNRFTRVRNHVRESWADIDVQLRRRHDLIPNLVETVKAYAAHERDVLERLMEARSFAGGSHASSQLIHDERALVGALNLLFVRAEAYPQLRSSEQFQELQEELTLTEDRIAAARRFYNANVREFNTLLASFPSSVIGAFRGLEALDYFEVDALAIRGPVNVIFTSEH